MEDYLMIHPMSRVHIMRSEYLLEKLEDARNALAAAERDWQEYLEPEEEPVAKKPDREFAEVLKYWRKYGAPQINLQDESEAFKSHADGKTYTSKRKYRDELKAHDMIEIGDERGAFEDLGKVDEKAADYELKKLINEQIGDSLHD